MKCISFLIIIGFLLMSQLIYGQSNNSQLPTSINTSGNAPDASSVLDVQSTDKGVLIPRMSGAQMYAISSPATGLLIYNSDFDAFYYHDGTSWVGLSGSSASSINGLSDGKSDAIGASLFLGLAAGAYDDGTDNRNVGVGYEALFSNVNGFRNTATGYQALYSNVGNGFNNFTGHRNTANGYQSLFSNTTGENNTANGYQSLYSNTTGFHNTALGLAALKGNITGSGNVALGYAAGLNETGSNKLYISNSSTSSPLIYGEFDTEKLTINGDLEVTGSNNLTSGLEAIDEGNGIGWRLKGRDPAYYGNIGLRSVDLSIINNGFSDAEGASGKYSTAMGLAVTASGEYSTAKGRGTIASGGHSTAMGYGTTSSGDYSTAMGGFATASGNYSTAMGGVTEAKGNYTTAMGSYNYDLAGQDRLLIVGNGTSSNRSNAFTVYQGTDANLTTFNSGYVMIGNNSTANLLFDTNEIMARNNSNPANLHLQANGGDVYLGGSIVHSSDMRLKRDIEALPYGLKEVLQLQPKAYYWKDRKTDHKSLGLIAQEVQPLIKEVITEKDDEAITLGVNYTELIPVLINAIQEQQVIIEEQKGKLENQQSTLKSVLNRLDILESNTFVVEKKL